MELTTDGPTGAPHTVVLAHGAGAAMDSPFMQEMAIGIAAAGIRVVRFEFPYMAARRGSDRRPGPDRPPVLQQVYRDVVAELGGGERLVIGGKSMGGRVASMLADRLSARGLLCLGYPFHPPGRPERLRVDHLRTLRTPALFLQGTRDALGSRGEIARYGLPASIQLRYLEDGDHSFKPRKRSGRTLPQAMAEAIEASVAFVEGL